MTKHHICFLAAVSLLASCSRKPTHSASAFSLPFALASASKNTAEFTLPSARYGVYLVHDAACSTIRVEHPEHVYERYKDKVACDLTVTIYRYMLDGPILLERHLTAAPMASSANFEAAYDLGYFETAEQGKLVIVVSNAPSRHDDAACHARVEVREIVRM